MNFKLLTRVASMVCLASVIIGLGFALVGCDKIISGDSPNGTEPSIYGKWQGSQFDIDDNDVWVDITTPPHDADFAFTIEFNEDGTYLQTGYLGNGGGEFRLSDDSSGSGSVITLYKENNRNYATIRITELTSEQMEVVVDMNPGIFRFRLQPAPIYEKNEAHQLPVKAPIFCPEPSFSIVV